MLRIYIVGSSFRRVISAKYFIVELQDITIFILCNSKKPYGAFVVKHSNHLLSDLIVPEGWRQGGEHIMTEETAVMKALKNEQARLEVMKIIRKIREMGGTQVILTLAGYILTATPQDKKPDTAA